MIFQRMRISRRIAVAKGELVRLADSDAPSTDMKEVVEAIKVLSEAKTLLSERNSVVDALMLFLIAIGALVFTANIHLRSAATSIDADTSEVTVSSESISSPEDIQFHNASLGSVSALGLTNPNPSELSDVTIANLHASANAELTVSKTSTCLTLGVRNGTLTGLIWIGSERHFPLRLGIGKSSTDFNVCGTLLNAANIALKPREINISRRITYGLQQEMVQPAIASGRIVVGSNSVKPNQFDVIQARFNNTSPSSGYIRILPGSDHLIVALSGEATELVMGPVSNKRNLIPTVLQHVTTDRSWSLFYSSLMVSLGIIWKLRALLS
jgi:hypothetical protein